MELTIRRFCAGFVAKVRGWVIVDVEYVHEDLERIPCGREGVAVRARPGRVRDKAPNFGDRDDE